MSTKPQTWAVASTMREPVDQTLAFVAHHLAMGASEVQVFLDDPHDPALPLLKQIDGCIATPCGPRHWSRHIKIPRPELQTMRQAANATLAYSRTRADWLIHADADEFLYLTQPFEEVIAQLKSPARWMRIPNLERCWVDDEDRSSVFSGVFRHTIRPDNGRTEHIYGKTASEFLSLGQLGSAHGKPLVPAGQEFRIGIHAAKWREGDRTDWPPQMWAKGIYLLHFDGLTPLHWAAKTLRYAEHPDEKLPALLHEARQKQVRHVRDVCASLQDVLSFYESLSTLRVDQAETLSEMDLLSRCEIDPVADVKAVLPDHTPDYSAATFDTGLGLENAARLMRKIKGQPVETV